MTVIATQSKSVLAKLLATENITMQKVAGAQTAYFDVKNRVLTLPIWQGISEDLEDMLVVHEVGHALDTPCDGWTNAIKDIASKIYGVASNQNQAAVKGFLNVIEDARIDKRQKRRYPGARRNYIVGYKELIDRDFFGTANKDINSYNFIDRINIYFKGGVALGVKFSPEENAFVKRIDAAETFKEVVKITEEVFAYAKLRGEEDQKIQMEALRSGEGDEDEGEDFGDDFDTFEDDDEDGEDSKGYKGEGDISASDDQTDDEEDGDGDDRDQTSNGAGSGDFIPESKTEKAWEQKQTELVANGSTTYQYVGVSKPVVANIVDDYKLFLKENAGYHKKFTWNNSGWFTTIQTEVVKFRTEENASISFMVKEFEMKKSADIFSRISIAKTGVLDTNKIHSYKYNEDIFRRQAIVPTGKNHGFVMILDWSGSMHGNLKDTIKQLIGLTSFCKRTQIPFEVYTFRDPTASRGKLWDTAEGDLEFESITMRNILSSRMNVTELNEAYSLLWAMSTCGSHHEPMGGTPLNGAIVVTEQLVNQFKARSKVQIVNVIFLTDGESNTIKGVKGVEIGHRWGDSNTKYIIQDKVMKKDYYLTDHIYNCAREITINLLKMLKDRTGCNLIGFYLNDYSSTNRVVQQFYGHNIDEKFRAAMVKCWNENKFIPVTNHGYDDYYVINAQAMKDTENKLDINVNTMTKAKIAKEFQKFSSKKAVNRVLLQRFIDKIASDKKKVA